MNATVLYEEERKNPLKPILGALVAVVLAAGVAGAYAYIDSYRPDIIKQIRIHLQSAGLAPTDPAEIARVNQINRLTITHEEKQILINRTIFMGATPQMVMLALGDPKQGQKMRDPKTGQEAIILVYHLPEDLRPTMLRFDDGKLTHAYKGSNMDFADITGSNTALEPASYTGANSE